MSFSTPVSYTHLDVYKRQVLTTQYLDECLTQFPDFLAEQAESLQKALKNGQLDLMVNLHNSIWDSLAAFSIDTIR